MEKAPSHLAAGKPPLLDYLIEDNTMSAPILSRLEAAIVSTDDPDTQALLAVQIACYLARVGDFEEAERLRVELRKQFGDGHHAQISIRLICLDALLLYFKDLDPNAKDRLARAKLLAKACRQAELVAFTSAWLAHIDFNLELYEEMALGIADCFEAMGADDGTARCRVSLVLGDAFAYCMREDASRRWYEEARVTATKLGDQAAIGAVTYNRAALNVVNARLTRLLEPTKSLPLLRLDAEVRSAINYQRVAQLKSLDHLLSSAAVGVAMLQERYDVALFAAATLMESGAVRSDTSAFTILLADHMLATAKLGKTMDALALSKAIAGNRLQALSADDEALVANALSETSAICGKTDAALMFGLQRDQALATHQVTIGTLAKVLEPYAGGPSATDGGTFRANG